MDDSYIRKIAIAIILVVLIVLAFFLIRPILLAIISGIILAFIFAPVYNKLFKLIKSKHLPAILICLVLLVAIILPFWFLIPVFVDQSVKLYSASQQIDLISPLKTIFPSIISTSKFSEEIASIISTSITKLSLKRDNPL